MQLFSTNLILTLLSSYHLHSLRSTFIATVSHENISFLEISAFLRRLSISFTSQIYTSYEIVGIISWNGRAKYFFCSKSSHMDNKFWVSGKSSVSESIDSSSLFINFLSFLGNFTHNYPLRFICLGGFGVFFMVEYLKMNIDMEWEERKNWN